MPAFKSQTQKDPSTAGKSQSGLILILFILFILSKLLLPSYLIRVFRVVFIVLPF